MASKAIFLAKPISLYASLLEGRIEPINQRNSRPVTSHEIAE
jgi:hypothetical protein